jgi:hypothetical protein
MDFDIFVSHSSKDKEKAKLLAKDLTEQNYKVWFDSNIIEPSDDWVRKIEEGVDNSSVVVVLWTENAVNSEWVQRELARADQSNKPIIPLIFDNTQITILLQRTQHIDFRKGYFSAFPNLVSYLTRYLEVSEITAPIAAWKYVKQPFYRSRFLEENSYLNRKGVDFAVNEHTRQLHSYNAEKATSFVTFVSIPIPEAIDFDFDILLSDEVLRNSNRVIRSQNAELPWQFFNLNSFYQRRTTQSDFTLYDTRANTHAPISHIRFTEDGAIEYGDAYNSVQQVQMDSFNGTAFDFIQILGSTWKFINLALNMYQPFGYSGLFQILINLKNTSGATLAGFAAERNYNNAWPSLISSNSFARIRLKESGQGIASDNNIQLVYNVNLPPLLQAPQIIEDIILDLSNRLQRSFSFEYKLRHYIQNTNEFPWHQLSELGI